MKAYLHVAALCFALAAPAARADDVDRYIAQQQRVYGLPAVVAGVIRDGRLVEKRAAGLASVELAVPATTEQVFEIGSISKQFTAYAILMLHEQGKLDLDAPVGRYLTELPPAWGRVSLHRLLTHTSGLPDLEAAYGYPVYRETPGDIEFLARVLKLPIDFEPGERWAYSNTNYWLLARVIERASGESYASFMRARVFTPLGMKSTRSSLPEQLLPGRAAGYQGTADGLENRDAIRSQTGRGLGDIATTLVDMAAWEREQLAPTLVSARTAERARQPVRLNDGTPRPYGYGWSTEPVVGPGATTLSHSGQTAGFTAAYVRLPERRLAVVVFINDFDGDPMNIAVHLIEAAEPALKPAAFTPIAETDPATTLRVRQLLETGAAAEREWQAEWFATDYWQQIRPWLAEIALHYRRLGPLRSISPVAQAGTAEPSVRHYRIVYDGITRLVTVRFDGEGRIASRTTVDE